uniref:gamma-glutamylcyclotransferase-like n=1 Tax=Styela clava TaxID=7725 RepID=UPI001939E839|nr:gamma-glutamylcyclotransferase-like [Styela clava]
MSTFKYFGYASNLADYKVGLECKSCRLESIARLDGFTLSFGEYCPDWCGGSATLRKEAGSEVWGAVWVIDNSEMDILDEQEHVTSGQYKAVIIEVVGKDDRIIQCRAYEQIDKQGEPSKPSPQYLAVILDGARKCGLPNGYIAKLEAVETNGNSEITELMVAISERRKAFGLLSPLF